MTRPDVLQRRMDKLEEYLAVDRQLVYERLQRGLDDIRDMMRFFAQYL